MFPCGHPAGYPSQPNSFNAGDDESYQTTLLFNHDDTLAKVFTKSKSGVGSGSPATHNGNILDDNVIIVRVETQGS
jgi:hypothetical protein